MLNSLWYFLEYLSYAVALQGAFAVAVIVLALVEHFSGKKGESDRTSRDLEKAKLKIVGTWSLVTLVGFYYDAVSTPAFKQAFSIVRSELAPLVGYISVFGSLICLLYASYKITLYGLYLYRNKDGSEANVTPREDGFFREILELDLVLPSRSSVSSKFKVGTKDVHLSMDYPDGDGIPEGAHEKVREKALAIAEAICREIEERDIEYRTKIAERLCTREDANEASVDQLAAQVRLDHVLCSFELADDRQELDIDDLTLMYSNGNGFGGEKFFARLDEDCDIDLSLTWLDEIDDEEGSQDVEEESDGRDAEISDEENQYPDKSSYL